MGASPTTQGTTGLEDALGQLNGPSLVASVTNLSNLDLIQIVSSNGGSVLLNVDKNGAVHNPAVSPTGTALFGTYLTRLASGTTAALFADAFSNPSSLDILQVNNEGGNISYWLDSAGVAHGS